jgi:hypothetical protein
LRVAHGRGDGFRPKSMANTTCLVGCATRTVIAQSLDFGRRMQCCTEAIFHGRQHHVAHDVTAWGMPSWPSRSSPRGRRSTARLSRLAVVASEIEAVRTPTLVAMRHGNFIVAAPLRTGYCRTPLCQQPMSAHAP